MKRHEPEQSLQYQRHETDQSLRHQRYETPAPTVIPHALPTAPRLFREPLTPDEQKAVFTDWFHL